MILDTILGILVSSVVIIFFGKMNFMKSINQWIKVISKFIYYSGHPLLDEDAINEEIIERYRSVLISFGLVILKTLLIFFIIFTAIFLSSVLAYSVREQDFNEILETNFSSHLIPYYLFGYPFIIGSILPMIAIPLLSKKKDKRSVYSPIDEFLHYTFMGNSNIAMFLFKMELFIHKKKRSDTSPMKSVYIAGLARAGTTALVQTLGQINEFASLSYKHLPFVFIPYTWPKLVGKRKAKHKERLHQDGIMHGLESIEALEEPFWRNTIGHRYIKKDCLEHHGIEEKTFKSYTSFRKLIARDKIYLAKNNNHLLRAETIHRKDREIGNSTMTIIPFRDPYEQANSLLNQHILLSKLQEENEFILDYMDFLVHHEFGMNHKPPIFDANKPKAESKFQESQIEYWLDIWYDFYSETYLKYSEENKFYFFCYEDFVLEPRESVEKLLAVVGMNKDHLNSIEFKKHNPKIKSNNESVDSKFMVLYNKMRSKSLNLL